MSNFYIKGLNSCAMRNQNIAKYKSYLTAIGYTETTIESEADNILVWTCSFRDDMAENSFLTINSLINEYSKAEIYILGCMPDMFPRRFDEMRCHVIPWKNEDSMFEKHFPPPPHNRTVCNPILSDYDLIHAETPITHASALFLDSFIKLLISEGCNEKCSYCSERLAFPPYRSFPVQELVKTVKERIIETGCNRIALMADSPGEYGSDTGNDSIVTLINAICDIRDDVQIIIHNMNPVFLLLYLNDFKSLILSGKIYHLNLPMQSANDRVLRAMGRRYSKNDLSLLFDSLTSWNFKKFDTHVIAGFPTETSEEFDETIEFLCQKLPTYVLGSPCMVTSVTETNDMNPKVSEDEKHRRLEKLDETLSSVGIIVNTPFNKLAKRRISEINKRGIK